MPNRPERTYTLLLHAHVQKIEAAAVFCNIPFSHGKHFAVCKSHHTSLFVLICMTITTYSAFICIITQFPVFGKICSEIYRKNCNSSMPFTCLCSAMCFHTFCAEIPSFSARNRIFLRFLCIAKRVTGHGVTVTTAHPAASLLQNLPIPSCLRQGTDSLLSQFAAQKKNHTQSSPL